MMSMLSKDSLYRESINREAVGTTEQSYAIRKRSPDIEAERALPKQSQSRSSSSSKSSPEREATDRDAAGSYSLKTRSIAEENGNYSPKHTQSSSLRSPKSSSERDATKHMPALEPRELTNSELEQVMQAIIPIDNSENNLSEVSDTSFDSIANLLHQAGREEWSLRPRTYAVLRMINSVQLLDDFVSADFWDIELPYAFNTLPPNLSPSQRHKFLEKQDLVLTKAAKIEGGKDSSHASFGKDADNYLESLNELGRGGYGSVDRVRSKLSHKEYVRKRMNRSTVFEHDRKALKLFKNEIEILKRLNHRHLIRYVGSYTDPKYVGILMEPIAECDMQAFLSRSSFSVADFVCIRQAFGCLCAAIIYLQEKQCRHKDIKPHNILVKGSKVLITDFGIARDWTGRGKSTTTGAAGAFSPEYAAPEVVEQQARNSSSDIWSLGCVFLDMVTVLKSEKLSEKMSYFESHGNCGTNPRTNYEAYKGWMKHLQSRNDTHPLKWITDMVRISPKARLTAQLLMSQITECDDDNQYSGFCCDGQEESLLPAELKDSEYEDGSSEDNSADEKRVLDPDTLEKRLCKAAKTGDITSAKRWLRKIPGIKTSTDGESRKSFETRALHHAARTGNDGIVDLLIRSGCNLDAKWGGQTPLLLAAINSHEEIIQLLAWNKATVNSRDDKTLGTALHFATAKRLYAAMQTLLDCGATVNSTDKIQESPLHIATRKGDSKSVELLLDYGADVSLKDRKGYSALHLAAKLGFEKIIVQLLDHEAEINDQSANEFTALHLAAVHNQPAASKLLLQRGADINRQSTRSRVSALHVAVAYGHPKVVEALFTSKPDLEIRDESNLTPLLVLLEIRYKGKALLETRFNGELLRLLLEANANVNAKFNELATPIGKAILKKDLELAQVLIDHGASLEGVGERGETLLHHVAARDNQQSMLFMLENNANIEATDLDGSTPLIIATKKACIINTKLLLMYGARTNAKDRVRGAGALHFAADAGLAEAVSLLLEHGADPLERDRAGRSPLDLSMLYHRTEITGLIRNALAIAGFVDDEGKPMQQSNQRESRKVSERENEVG